MAEINVAIATISESISFMLMNPLDECKFENIEKLKDINVCF